MANQALFLTENFVYYFAHWKSRFEMAMREIEPEKIKFDPIDQREISLFLENKKACVSNTEKKVSTHFVESHFIECLFYFFNDPSRSCGLLSAAQRLQGNGSPEAVWRGVVKKIK